MRGNRKGNRRKWNRGGGGGQYNQQGGGYNSANPRTRLDNNDNDFEMGVYETGGRGPQRYSPYGASSSGGRRGRGGYNNQNSGAPYNSGPSNRRPPYGEGGNYQRGRGGGYNNRNSGGRGQGGGASKCFRVVVPGLKRGITKEWLMQSLQQNSAVPFQPIGLQVVNEAATFYVEGVAVANALRETSRKITANNGFKLIVIVTAMKETPTVVRQQAVLDPQTAELVKVVMSKRYNVELKYLNMSNFAADPDLKEKNLVLGRHVVMNTVLKVIAEYIPEVNTIDLSSNKLVVLDSLKHLTKSAKHITKMNLSKNFLKSLGELDRIKALKLTELILDGNPVCNNFTQQVTYISEVRKRFPKVMMLDGNELPPPISFGDEDQDTCLPPIKGSFYMNEQLQQMIPQFLTEYFKVYDSGDRQGLLDAYHDNACFSLVGGCSDPLTKGASLRRFYPDSRNLLRTPTQAVRTKLLKKSRLNVVAFLNSLPNTEHNMQSLVVDVSLCQGTLLVFTVNGVNKEENENADKRQSHLYRAFTRVFAATPSPSGGLLLTNDELYIRNMTEAENKFVNQGVLPPHLAPAAGVSGPLVSSPHEAMSAPPTVGVSSPPTAAPLDQQKQQQMIEMFAQQTGMNLQWAFECLKQNEWNMAESYRTFTELNAQGKMPPEAFQK